MTPFYVAVASRLRKCTTSFVIQNPAFRPRHRAGVTVIEPWRPRRDERVAEVPVWVGEELRIVGASDRRVTFGGRSTNHYEYYAARLIDWITTVQPDVIIGDLGSFHSHLCCLIAKQLGIPFLNPMSSRYPPGRFSFFLYDRLCSVGGEMISLPRDVLAAICGEIAGRKVRPDYMAPRRKHMKELAYRKYMIASGFLRGERFNNGFPGTGSIDRAKIRCIVNAWDEAAHSVRYLDTSRERFVLYPMQMQPEVNLDIWGREFRNQLDIVRRLAISVGRSGRKLLVKLNPKAGKEVSRDLVEFVRGDNRVVALSSLSDMGDILPFVDLVITATGSVAIERIVCNRPVAILSDDYRAWLGLPGSVVPDLERVDVDELIESSLPRGVDVGVKVLDRLVKMSYQGVIDVPTRNHSVMCESNVRAVADAIVDVCGKLNVINGTTAE